MSSAPSDQILFPSISPMWQQPSRPHQPRLGSRRQSRGSEIQDYMHSQSLKSHCGVVVQAITQQQIQLHSCPLDRRLLQEHQRLRYHSNFPWKNEGNTSNNSNSNYWSNSNNNSKLIIINQDNGIGPRHRPQRTKVQQQQTGGVFPQLPPPPSPLRCHPISMTRITIMTSKCTFKSTWDLHDLPVGSLSERMIVFRPWQKPSPLNMDWIHPFEECCMTCSYVAYESIVNNNNRSSSSNNNNNNNNNNKSSSN
eukprot:PhF_6_TR44301/c1_g1_i4/m.68332